MSHTFITDSCPFRLNFKLKSNAVATPVHGGLFTWMSFMFFEHNVHRGNETSRYQETETKRERTTLCMPAHTRMLPAANALCLNFCKINRQTVLSLHGVAACLPARFFQTHPVRRIHLVFHGLSRFATSTTHVPAPVC